MSTHWENIQSLFKLGNHFSWKVISAPALFYSNCTIFTWETTVERGTHHLKKKKLPVATYLLIRNRNLSTVRKQTAQFSCPCTPTYGGFSTGVADFFFEMRMCPWPKSTLKTRALKTCECSSNSWALLTVFLFPIARW